ncbi:MAG: response regulator transcription factor [Candidatus Omnitrophica bacterium]|nr:response regulator transcription factor [Candidatus Omnitrophota bacterium]MCA9434240.1 response regulator transcription factor [Candidatus Omnitrophota bacterium]MCA9446038.1 response regulator transcription factor [Candidatus Omnitrophota bacterium]MCB9769769.1 response regulator transcription factor [Candidatus Omnitrophota bacterium]MCB9783823.1 response regulator transcription factor [Candidatus Omnitrophota bacterium]
MRETILVVDDERDIVRLLEYNLLEENFKVATALTGQDALKLASETRPDLIILDLMLPGIDGREVCKTLKRQPETDHIPIIILSAKASEVDRVIGFELGCDDYVVKPFNTRELILRVKAILRRMNPPDDTSEVIQIADLTINTAKHQVRLSGEIVDLTPTEFKLLVYLIRRKDRVQTREVLLNQVWGLSEDEVDTRTVDTHVRRLRQKLGHLDYTIKTVRSLGYIFKPPASGLVGGPGYKFEDEDEEEELANVEPLGDET